MKTVMQIVAEVTRLMVMGTFRSPDHNRNCVCVYCENAAARLLSDYARDIDAEKARKIK